MKWPQRLSRGQRPTPWRPRSARPAVERLEDRRVPAIAYHGGPVVPHVDVEAAFYGQSWNAGPGLQQATDLDTYLGYLVNSSYMDMLGEYGVGRGSLVDSGIVDPNLSAGQTVDDTAIRQMIDRNIGSGALTPPDANRLFVVFTAPNVVVTDGGQDSLHDFFGYHDSFTDPAGRHINYAVIAHPVGNGDFSTLNDFQTLTKVTSHEVAEAVTDPDGNAWYNARTGDEIGDVANGANDLGTLNGYVVQAEWSVRQQTAVLPAGAQVGVSFVPSQGEPPAVVLNEVANAFTHSDEYFGNLVQADYQQLLGRAPGANEVNVWVAGLEHGLTDEQMIAAFASSPEFYQHAGGTDRAWVDALYRDVLSRAPDAAGENAWIGALASGQSRGQVALGFATSLEREANVVRADYQTYLGRSASNAEVASWVNAFGRGLTNEQLVAGFVSSNEYYQLQGGTTETWVPALYQSILGRQADRAEYDYWNALLENAAANA